MANLAENTQKTRKAIVFRLCRMARVPQQRNGILCRSMRNCWRASSFQRRDNRIDDRSRRDSVCCCLANCLSRHPEVEPTNNRSERQARPEAMARKAARTSKSEQGVKRRGIMSVLASLSKRLENFTREHVLSEITRWVSTGQSIFREELAGFAQAHAPLRTCAKCQSTSFPRHEARPRLRGNIGLVGHRLDLMFHQDFIFWVVADTAGHT